MDLTDAPETNNAADTGEGGGRLATSAARASAPVSGRDREAGAGGDAAAKLSAWRADASRRVMFTGQERWFGASAQAGVSLDRFIEVELSKRNWRWLCTGTFKRKMFGDPEIAIKTLRRNIARHFRGRDFFGCAEQHQDGSWHVHFLLDEITPRSAVERFAFWWGFDNRELHLSGDAFRAMLNIGRADIREIRNRDAAEAVARVCSYVCKYLVKQGRTELWFCSLHHGDRRRSRDEAAAAAWHAGLTRRGLRED